LRRKLLSLQALPENTLNYRLPSAAGAVAQKGRCLGVVARTQ
jgi:hypothetical protein